MRIKNIFRSFVNKARFVEMFGDPKTNHKNYPVKKIRDTCLVITGNTPSRKVSEYYGDLIEWIKTDNIVPNMLNPTRAAEFLSERGKTIGRTVNAEAMLMYGKEASNRKQEIDRQHYTIPNQRPKDKHCGKI